MTDKTKTLIVALLDRTGSMQSVRSDTEGAFDAFMQAQRDATAEIGDEVTVTLYQFDRAYNEPITELIYANKPLTEVPQLQLLPRGTTPLHDALATTIIRVGDQLAQLDENQRPDKVIFIVMTDGQENSSVEYAGEDGRMHVKELVERQTNEWNWDFQFLGVGIDAFQVAGGYGIARQQTISVAAAPEDVRVGYATLNVNTVRSRKERS